MLLEELELQLGISSQGNVEIVKVLSWMVECRGGDRGGGQGPGPPYGSQIYIEHLNFD